MRTGKRTIERGDEYNYLFQPAKGEFIEVKKYAALNDTVGLMKDVILKTLDDTAELAKMLKAGSTMETCRNVWNFCFHHIQYEKDAVNIEQVRRPARVWKDRFAGVDCDCLTVFIGSILTNLRIPFVIRITKYSEGRDFEHVYPVAIPGNQPIILDTVVHAFNYEVPFTQKKDISMKLEYLNGFEDDEEDDFGADDENQTFGFEQTDVPEDAEALLFYDSEDLEGLEGKAKREARKAKRAEKREEKAASGKPTLKDRLKKGLNVINKLNPATALLRAGILASMKLNIGKGAAKLRYAYWTEAEANANQMEPGKYQQLQQVRKKLENIFYGAGGNLKNLKKAILTGKGNKDKRVGLNGLGAIVQPVSDYQDLQTVIGHDTYAEEFDEMHSNTSINGLGEPITIGAAVAAASGVIAAIVAMIKKLGGIFKKGSPQEQQEIINDNTADEEEKTRPMSLKNIAKNVSSVVKNNPLIANRLAPVVASKSDLTPESSGSGSEMEDRAELDETGDSPTPTELDVSTLPAPVKPDVPAVIPSGDNLPSGGGTASAKDTTPTKDDTPPKAGLMAWVQEHKALTAGIVIGTIGLAYLGYRAYQNSKKKESTRNLSGSPAGSKGGKQTRTAKGGIKKVKLL
jgi:hypothetical protein